MKVRTLSEIAAIVHGRLLGGDAAVSAVVTDSRVAGPGDLFIALRGEHDDGARFAQDALSRGAAGVLVPDDPSSQVGPAVAVASTGEALLSLATRDRAEADYRVAAITGANGKTSTKDLTASALGSTLNVHASPGSFNNEIGLPMTLLGAQDQVDVVVAELGARRKGDVTLLCEVAQPDVVVVTNVGLAHIEIFGSWDAIVEASAEPVEALGSEGTAVLNADDPVVAGYATRCAGRVITFGTSPETNVRGLDVRLDADGCARATIEIDGERSSRTSLRLAVPGEHMVSNALASVAVGMSLGIEPSTAAEALAGATVSPWRMERFTTKGGLRVVNDAYNANPESTAAALRAARWMAGEARLIAVLGEMAELGSLTTAEHERVGELAARLRVDRVIAVGEAADPIAIAAVREGVEPENVAAYGEPTDALADIIEHAEPGDLVLFKGSRVAGLERLAEALR